MSILESEDHKTVPEQQEIRSQIVKKEMSLFEAPKKRWNNLKRTVPCLKYNRTQISGTREGLFCHGTICHKSQKQTKWWTCVLNVMRQYYEHHWKTVANLINNSLINCGGTNSGNFTMILSFIAQNRIHFKTRKKPGFLFSATRNPGFKICPELETLAWSQKFRLIPEPERSSSAFRLEPDSPAIFDNSCGQWWQTGVPPLVYLLTAFLLMRLFAFSRDVTMYVLFARADGKVCAGFTTQTI